MGFFVGGGVGMTKNGRELGGACGISSFAILKKGFRSSQSLMLS